MRDYNLELENRVRFIKNILINSSADGIVYGNSGGKDSALVGILCKKSCVNTLAIIMPCSSKRNYGKDKEDALIVANQYEIETRVVELDAVKNEILKSIENTMHLNEKAIHNIAPRLRMTTLYAVASNENRFVAGTGNLSEIYTGYFTKWGDGACDFNPIADLTVTEIYEFLHFLNAPKSIIDKAPSAGLYDEQTDESEMGVSYKSIDNFLLNKNIDKNDKKIIENMHLKSEHKRTSPSTYKNNL